MEGKTSVITLADPRRLNALTVEMGKEFIDVVAKVVELANLQKTNACIVTGEGGNFSAGGDLQWLRERHTTSPFSNTKTMVDFYNRFLCIRKIPVPTIACIKGAAIGAGAALTLACDIRVADTSSKIGFTFTRLGIPPGMGSTVLLPRIVGHERAAFLFLSAKVMSGEEARETGVVLEVVPPEGD